MEESTSKHMSSGEETPDDEQSQPLLRALPKRPKLNLEDIAAPAPQVMRRVRPKASFRKTIGRALLFAAEILGNLFAVGIDAVLKRDTVERRASRMRESIERLGGSAVKLGQQLSLRADLIPFEYCQELSKMLDSTKPMPFEQARLTIERSIGGSLETVFRAFDPTPIGSASVACVYQAHLCDGSRVAVKVRRPSIGELFAADLRAFGWVLKGLEWLTIFRPGFTKQLRADLREMLFEELDFVQEARYQELFRHNAINDGMDFFTAPELYASLSSEEVIVQEFVEGVWASEIIQAVQNDDSHSLKQLKERGIHPPEVSRRLLMAAYWSIHENMFFHADPHPANLLVDDQGRLVFVDFGACGPTSQRSRRLQAQILHRFWQNDIEGAARASLALIAPLPLVDTDELVKRASAVWWRKLYAMRSQNTPWWDRTTASVWISLLEVTREYNIIINLDTLRAIRASLLYDTLAVRIWKDADDLIFAEYEQGARRRRAARFLKRITPQLDVDLLSIADNTADLLERLYYRADEFADSQPLKVYELPSKSSYVLSLLISWFVHAGGIFCLIVAMRVAWMTLSRQNVPSALELFSQTAQEPFVVIALGVYLILLLNRIQYRLRDRDSCR